MPKPQFPPRTRIFVGGLLYTVSKRDIESFFRVAGWMRLTDPSGHLVFYNYAFQVIAIDAVGRNCYLTNGELQPFDVILCHPGPELEEFLRIYPE